MSATRTLADRWQDGRIAEDEIGDGLIAFLEDWDSLSTDPYDNSLEIHKAPEDARLSTEAREFLLTQCGFSKIYLNHKDGWETHYSSTEGIGWRRRYVSDPTATTTNVIAGPPNPGYFEVSYMPDGFPKEWLETGYMRIVPDPLAPS